MSFIYLLGTSFCTYIANIFKNLKFMWVLKQWKACLSFKDILHPSLTSDISNRVSGCRRGCEPTEAIWRRCLCVILWREDSSVFWHLKKIKTVMVNGIISLISLTFCWWCVLILYLATFPNSLMSSSTFLVASLAYGSIYCMDSIMSL